MERIARWLEDEEVSSMWFGRSADGTPTHLGYMPSRMMEASPEEWDRVFNDPHRAILSICGSGGDHLGEAQLVLEEALGNAELSILIGRKDIWHRGYGMATVRALLDMASFGYGYYRVWVDIPEYNVPALEMFRRLGFTHEGTLRKSRPYMGDRADSYIMGVLVTEYAQMGRQEERELLTV